jgi:uncharacterized ferredoxin-like protein
MSVVESGRHALTAEVHALRTGIGECEHLSTRADREHAIAGERERLDLARARGHRQDPAVIQDGVRTSGPTGERGSACAESCEDESAAAEAFSHGFFCSVAGACE